MKIKDNALTKSGKKIISIYRDSLYLIYCCWFFYIKRFILKKKSLYDYNKEYVRMSVTLILHKSLPKSCVIYLQRCQTSFFKDLLHENLLKG